MPSMIGRKNKTIFGYLRHKIWKKVHHWSGRHLSKARREVFIKSVAQAIPSYCMTIFLLPTTLQDEMQSMMNSFRWDSNRNVGKKSIGLVGNVFLRKELGGGFSSSFLI